MVTGWIQSSDFSSKDLGSLDAEQAIEYLKNHNWANEIEQEEKLRNEGNESCPAGIGLESDKNVLHICPEAEDESMVFFHHQEPKRILGIIPTSSQVTETKYGVSNAKCHDLIRLLFRADYDGLKREFARL